MSETYWLYRIYGLLVRTNRPLPGLTPVSSCASVELRVQVGGAQSGSPRAAQLLHEDSLVFRDGVTVGFQLWAESGDESNCFRLRCYGHGEVAYVINADGSAVWISPPPEDHWADVASLLLSLVMGCVLRLRGATCLHASVLAVGHGAMAILGGKGVGKSTTATALVRRGCPLLADDMAVLTEGAGAFMVQPGYPHLRLWSSAIRALYGSTEALPRVLSCLDKYYLHLTTEREALGWRFQEEALPLKLIYVLRRGDAGLAVPVIKPLSSAERLASLITHTSAHYVPLERSRRVHELACLSRLATTIHVRMASCPEGLDKLSQLCDAILEDYEARSRRVA
jgi:hypothetical protein